MNYIKFIVFICVVIAAGCSSTVSNVNTFNAAEASFINEEGKAKINGQAFLRRNDGLVVYAAGSEVFLIPSTAYSDERLNAIYQGKKSAHLFRNVKFENDSLEYKNYIKSTKADGEGEFEFSNVAAGTYYLTTQVYWTPDPNAIFPEGAKLLEKVEITQDTNDIKIIMSGS